MKLKLTTLSIILFFGLSQSFAQDTILFNYTGGPQTLDIPPCAIQVSVDMCGGSGGAQGPQFNQGLGACVTGILTVAPGSTIEINVGGAGGCGNGSGGYNGGGNGVDNTYTYDACGGGGASDIRIAPYGLGERIAVAAGGGGEGGGGGGMEPSGGDGGCASGVTSSMFSWGDPGNGGTQTAGGTGGGGWGSGNPGQAGSLGQGGNGATDPCYAIGPGGGGGGGYYGGGGGGSDCWAGGHLGGGGGGGGSSLTPLGGGCVAGQNDGDGYVQVIIEGCDEPTICSGDTTVIDFTDAVAGLTVTGYSWAPAAGVEDPNGGPVMNVFPADSVDYVVTVSTTTGDFDLTFPVHVVQQIEPDAGLDDSLCWSTTNGAPLSATLWNDGDMFWEFESANTFSGGPGNAVFAPGNTDPNPTATVNLAGEYYYVLHEADTNDVCPEGTDTVMIYYSQEVHTAALTDPLCFGYCDGEITINSDNSAASGNLGANQYSIDGVNYQASPTFVGLCSGTYTIESMDYLGCSFTSDVDLVDPDPIVMSLVSSDTTICQNGTATLVAQASGAPVGGTYDYYWLGGGSGNANSTTVTPTPAGTDMSVDVYAQTDLGCYSDTLTLNIDHYDPLSGMITANDTVCPGYDTDHQVSNVAGGFLGGQADYNYVWTSNGALTTFSGTDIFDNPTVVTEYCVTVTDACETTPWDTCTFTYMRNVPDPMFTSDLTWGCNPTTIKFWNTTDPIDTDSVTWLINGNYYFDAVPLDTLEITFSEVGTYDVWLEVYSEFGCHDAIMAQEYITIHDVPEPMFYVNPNPTTMFNTGVEMNNVTPGANNTYTWSFPGGSPTTSSLENPSVFYPEGVVGDYPVTLTATNEWGCVNSIDGEVQVVSDVLLYAPNIFTPDGDEFNETWRVYIDGIDIYNFHLTMFNRWGEPVWESYNQNAEWVGHYGDNGKVQDGTFVWVIECREINTDKKYEFRGHVTVLK